MITLMDCTLRDGANVVGKGFSAEITDMVLEGLTACHVPIIELGNAGAHVILFKGTFVIVSG